MAPGRLGQAQDQELLFFSPKIIYLFGPVSLLLNSLLKGAGQNLKGPIIIFFLKNKIIFLWKRRLPLHPYWRNFVRKIQERIKRSIDFIQRLELEHAVIYNCFQPLRKNQSYVSSGSWYLHALYVHNNKHNNLYVLKKVELSIHIWNHCQYWNHSGGNVIGFSFVHF